MQASDNVHWLGTGFFQSLATFLTSARRCDEQNHANSVCKFSTTTSTLKMSSLDSFPEAPSPSGSRRRAAVLFLHRIFLELPIQRGFANPQQARRQQLIAVQLHDSIKNGLFFQIGHGNDFG